jgi:hypothetical protein
MRTTAFLLALLLGPVGASLAQDEAEKPFKPEEIEALVAPIALHPDDLVSQILMASTYPLEVVEAARWVEKNKELKGDALAKALEEQTWDASVKSLVNVPEVLDMLNGKLDWTQKLGNAFLAQQKEVLDAIQKLRKKAQEEGTLETTEQQVVKTEETVIVIESSDPDVIYVPSYNPTVVYGTWPAPAYPPYPSPYTGAGLAFATGVACGLAWGYAWGGCNWGGGEVDIDIDRNVNRNTNINREKYKGQMDSRGTRGGKGSFKHDPSHRRGVGYGDKGTAQKFDRGASSKAQSRESFRGRSTPSTGDRAGGARGGSGSRDSSAFGGYSRGSDAKAQSSRGNSSRSSSRSSGSRGGGSRGGGGGRGGGRR